MIIQKSLSTLDAGRLTLAAVRPRWALLLLFSFVAFLNWSASAQTIEVDQIKAKAERGDVKSQITLATMYYRGQGVLQHFAEAAKWFRKAADQGDANASARLAVMFQRGEGVKQDAAEAAKWYRKAGEKGSPQAQGLMTRPLDNPLVCHDGFHMHIHAHKISLSCCSDGQGCQGVIA